MDKSDMDLLTEFIPGLGEYEEEKFKAFYDVLCHFNKRINLVSRASLSTAGARHFSDSYMGLKKCEEVFLDGKTVYDFGSGNGFPGVVSAIMYPRVKFILVERDRRKGEFLKFLCEELSLKNVGIHVGPAAELKDRSVDLAISRAMAPLPKILLELRTLVKKDGNVYLFKGDHWTTEFGSCPPQLFDLWEVKLKGSYIIPSLDMVRFIINCHRI